MCSCSFDADKIFKNINVVDFPKPFVGLEVTQNLNVKVNLNTTYIQTVYQGSLMNFDEAREISANHRAFLIKQVSGDTLQITFKPTTECIFKGKLQNILPNRFIICLSIIQVDGRVCCTNAAHQEIDRYYINGEYESINIFHKPKEISFGDVAINSTSVQYVRIFNESNQLFVNMKYVKIAGYDICPAKFTLNPKCSKSIKILVNPVCLKVAKSLTLQVKNSTRNLFNEEKDMLFNFLRYPIKVNINVLMTSSKISKIPTPESLHKLIEFDPRYAYMEQEQEAVNKKKAIALKQLEYSKSLVKKKKSNLIEIKRLDKCQSLLTSTKPIKNLCVFSIAKIPAHEVLNVFINPFYVNIGKVGIDTFGETQITVLNNSKYAVEISFIEDEYVKYTDKRLKYFKVKMRPLENIKLKIFVYAYCEEEIQGIFPYVIDDKYHRQHPYIIQGAESHLDLKETILKFGMVTSDTYITAMSVRIVNEFNQSINFRWGELYDSPFTITPLCGSVSKESIQICNISFDFRKPMTKIRTYNVDFISLGNKVMITPVELHIVARKIGVKFLQPAVCFKEVPMNLETKEKVQLENAGKEIASFCVIEPLFPGITIEPMRGIIRPKSITTFCIKLKIACALEFNIEITIKVNGKEDFILPINGHIIQPNVIVHPKNIYMARVPGEMITYMPVTFQNQSSLKSTIEFLDTGNVDDFNVYLANKNEKQKVNYMTLEGNETKIVYIKVYDNFRRQFDTFLSFRINGFIGPPTEDISSTDMGYYTGPHETKYEQNPKVKVKPCHKEINSVHIWGVITLPWIKLSPDKFEFNYILDKENRIEFTMTNVSKYDLNILISLSKLSPHFTLRMKDNNESIDCLDNGSQLKYVLKSGSSAELVVIFHPKGCGKFVSVALLYFLKHSSIPYHNLTFVGNRGESEMVADRYRIIFPPNEISNTAFQTFKIKLCKESSLDCFSYCPYEDPNVLIEFEDCIIETSENNESSSVITVKVTLFSETNSCRCTKIFFFHNCGASCEVEIYYCYSQCPLTLLATNHVTNCNENPYPYYPEEGTSCFNQMEENVKFLQKWMYLQGFRKDLYPDIPETIHATSTNIILQAGKSKALHGSYIHFIKRIAGPLLKLAKPSELTFSELCFGQVMEVYNTYKDILLLLRSRGANVWFIQPKYLLSFEQFTIYTKNTAPKCSADRIENERFLADENLFNRLNKQCWFDFITQSYKAFVIDTCFFECICITKEPRDIVKILITWYNEHISKQQNKLIGDDKKEICIENIVNDLTDGLALTSVFLSYCPFLQDHFSLYITVNEDNYETAVINNACLLIEAVNMLKMLFPLNIKSFMKPNFLEMFFLSIHLYITLPMYSVKQTIIFNPPLLRSSVRQMIITPSNQESLTFNYYILNNSNNNFVIEKDTEDKEKKVVIFVKFTCNFLNKETALLLVHGFNKTRIFDTFMTFMLIGEVGSISPLKKCKVVAPLYRSNKVDISIGSPFERSSVFKLYVMDVEPELPVSFEEPKRPRFYIRRLNLIGKEVTLKGHPAVNKESQEQEQKVFFNLICLSNQVGTSWVWFRSEIGEFYIRIMTHPRLDLPIGYLEANVLSLPIEPCSCGEECECYRTTAVLIPHRNDILIKALRQSLTNFASQVMMDIFDKYIESATGRIVLTKLLDEGGTIMSEVEHILQNEISYKITSRSLKLHCNDITLSQYSPQMHVLPITILPGWKSEKFTITLTSRCGQNIRSYKIILTRVYSSTHSYTRSTITDEEICACDV